MFSYLGNIKDPYPVLTYLKTLGKIEIENLKLVTVCDYFKIQIDAHDAMSDILATKKLIEILDEFFKELKNFLRL